MLLNNKYKQILLNILKYTDEIAETLVRFGNDKEDFDNDKVFRNAVSMPMLQIGELAKELKDDFRQEYPEVRVRGLVGMRNMFAHQYHNMDIDEIWSTATIDIPLIASVIKKILVDNNIDTEKDSVEET